MASAELFTRQDWDGFQEILALFCTDHGEICDVWNFEVTRDSERNHPRLFGRRADAADDESAVFSPEAQQRRFERGGTEFHEGRPHSGLSMAI
jgi:hypothetical protein